MKTIGICLFALVCLLPLTSHAQGVGISSIGVAQGAWWNGYDRLTFTINFTPQSRYMIHSEEYVIGITGDLLDANQAVVQHVDQQTSPFRSAYGEHNVIFDFNVFYVPGVLGHDPSVQYFRYLYWVEGTEWAWNPFQTLLCRTRRYTDTTFTRELPTQ